MESKSYVKNEPTVGMNFFGNIPPVGTESVEAQWIYPIGFQNRDHKIQRQKRRVSDIEYDKHTVKGFGSTTIFTFGLLTTARESGYHMRLDDDTG